MKLRTAMLVGVVALVALIIGSLLFAIQRTVDQGARDALDRVLARTAGSVEPVVGALRDRAATEARVTAIQPRLLALMATDAATIQDQADEFRRTLDASSLQITDPTGAVLGRAGDAMPPIDIKRAIEDGADDQLVTRDAAAFAVHVERLVQGEQALGALVVAHTIDDGLAAQLAKMLGDRPLVIRRNGRSLASAGLSPDVSAAIAAANGDEVAAGGSTWRLAHAAWPGANGQLELVIAADLGAALAPAKKLTLLIYVIGAIALAAALGFALLLGAALSRPVERLVGFTETIAAGSLDARAEIRGVRELRALATAMNRMAGDLDRGRRALADKVRLEDELAIASRIQTSILPKRFDVARLDVAATMEPASEVGGDYYDVIAAPDGAWIGIGDVAGHGLDAGLFALMAQTAIAAAVDARPDGAPRELVAAVNRILFANAWGRLGDPRHMTLTLARFRDDGRVVFAGAHMDLVVVRAGGAIETIKTPGTWVGLIDDVAAVTVDGELALAEGDTLVLYSDGVVEAADAAGAMFGLDRLTAAAAAAAGEGPAAVVAAVMHAVAAHRTRQDDDVTVLALRYRRAS